MRPIIFGFFSVFFQMSGVLGQNHKVAQPGGQTVFALGEVDKISSVLIIQNDLEFFWRFE